MPRLQCNNLRTVNFDYRSVNEKDEPPMARGMRDTIRRVRTATSAAMKRAVRHCKHCGRGQVPHRVSVGDGRTMWECRYCKTEQFR